MESKEETITPATEQIPEVVKDKIKALEMKAEGNFLYGESKFEEVGSSGH